MSTSLLFEYVLPEERIAQRPAPGRASRLLHVVRDPADGVVLRDRMFGDLPDILQSDDLLVLNNSRVIPSRFFVELAEGGTEAEVLLVEQETVDSVHWQALAKPMRRLKEGLQFPLSAHLSALVLGRTADQSRVRLELSARNSNETVASLIESEGNMPIPPYIRKGRSDEIDKEQYQTCFSEVRGSVAAPTAGLHFTDSLLEQVSDRGVDICFLTHHVGPASFLPVRDDDWQTHKMSTEHYCLPKESLEKIEKARREQRRVVVVGTTAVRALEAAWQNSDPVADKWQSTELFITPGFQFKVVDSLVTNFHQPCSTHLLLVAAILGVDNLATAYRHALAGEYRFLSYGDSMFVDISR